MILAAVAALLAQSPATSPDRPPISIVGIGNHSCGQWLEAQRDDGSRGAYYAWLGGFITGVNAGGARSYGNITDGTDFTGMATWIDNRCAANPLDEISSAALALAAELIRRKANRRR